MKRPVDSISLIAGIAVLAVTAALHLELVDGIRDAQRLVWSTALVAIGLSLLTSGQRPQR